MNRRQAFVSFGLDADEQLGLGPRRNVQASGRAVARCDACHARTSAVNATSRVSRRAGGLRVNASWRAVVVALERCSLALEEESAAATLQGLAAGRHGSDRDGLDLDRVEEGAAPRVGLLDLSSMQHPWQLAVL